jgi:hypothetical protein
LSFVACDQADLHVFDKNANSVSEPLLRVLLTKVSPCEERDEFFSLNGSMLYPNALTLKLKFSIKVDGHN